MAVLASTVHLRNPDTGRMEILAAGVAPPEWAAPLITNPKAWATPPEAPAQEPAPVPEPPAGQRDTPPVADGEGPPRRSGPGSGREAWAAYAREHGVLVNADDGRDSIIAALDEAGIPT